MKKKILVLPSWYPNSASRLNGIFIQDQVHLLSQRYDVVVLAPRLIGLRELANGKPFPKTQIEQTDGIRVYREEALVPPTLFFQLRNYLYLKISERGFTKILKDWGRPDIIHAHVVYPGGWAATKFKRKYEIPLILTEHSGPFSMHLQSKKQRMIVQQTLDEADRIIAVSPYLAGQIQDFYPNKNFDIIGNLVKTDFFTPLKEPLEKPNDKKIQFLSVALLNEAKGLNFLIEASQLLIKRGITSFELFIGGDGPALPRLKSLSQTLGIYQNCHFLGMLSRTEVRDWIQRCDAFVLPSLGESFGLVVAEAMSCGKPVIVTRCGGPEFFVRPGTGFQIEPANSKALADSMEKIISKRVSFDSNYIRQSIIIRFGEKTFLNKLSAFYEQGFK